jgi:hypothetical protein
LRGLSLFHSPHSLLEWHQVNLWRFTRCIAARAIRSSEPRVPSLHHRKEGWLRHQEISRSHKADADGVVSPSFPSENHPGLAISRRFAIFWNRSATPPCGDARRGLFWRNSNLLTHIQSDQTFFRRHSTLDQATAESDTACSRRGIEGKPALFEANLFPRKFAWIHSIIKQFSFGSSLAPPNSKHQL